MAELNVNAAQFFPGGSSPDERSSFIIQSGPGVPPETPAIKPKNVDIHSTVLNTFGVTAPADLDGQVLGTPSADPLDTMAGSLKPRAKTLTVSFGSHYLKSGNETVTALRSGGRCGQVPAAQPAWTAGGCQNLAVPTTRNGQIASAPAAIRSARPTCPSTTKVTANQLTSPSRTTAARRPLTGRSIQGALLSPSRDANAGQTAKAAKLTPAVKPWAVEVPFTGWGMAATATSAAPPVARTQRPAGEARRKPSAVTM